MSVMDDVITIICDIFDRDPSEVGPDTELVADLGAESVDFLELAMMLEDRFGIEVRPEKAFLQDFKSVYNSALTDGRDPFTALRMEFPYMTEERIRYHVDRIGRTASLAVLDIAAYVEHIIH